MLTRDQLTQRIEKLGGAVRGSVSKKTDLLIVGEDPGETKLSAAHEKGVPTLWWGLGEWLGLWSERSGLGWKNVDNELTSTLVTLMCSLVEDLLVRWQEHLDNKRYNAFVRATSATMYLLTLAWGPRLEERGELRMLPAFYLTDRNGRDDHQLLEDVQLVSQILQEICRVEERTVHALNFWLDMLEDLNHLLKPTFTR